MTKSEQIQIRVSARQKAALKRLARGAGQDVSAYVLDRVLVSAADRFDEILRALEDDGSRRFGLAELSDLLAGLPPARFEAAVGKADLRALSPVTANYVAAMVEHAASAARVRAPAWARDVPPLHDPFFATSLASLRPYLLRVAPVAFKRRNLFVDATVGARV